jgi:hypothetical protein
MFFWSQFLPKTVQSKMVENRVKEIDPAALRDEGCAAPDWACVS